MSFETEEELQAYRVASEKVFDLRTPEDKLLIAKRNARYEENLKLAITPFQMAICRYYLALGQALRDAISKEPLYAGYLGFQLNFDVDGCTYVLTDKPCNPATEANLPVDEDQSRRCIESAIAAMPKPPSLFPRKFDFGLVGCVPRGGPIEWFLDLEAGSIATGVMMMCRHANPAIFIPPLKDSIFRLSVDYEKLEGRCIVLRPESADKLDQEIADMILKVSLQNFESQLHRRKDELPIAPQMCFFLDDGELRGLVPDLTTIGRLTPELEDLQAWKQRAPFTEEEKDEALKQSNKQRLRRYQLQMEQNPGDLKSELEYLVMLAALGESEELKLSAIESGRRIVEENPDSALCHEKLAIMLLRVGGDSGSYGTAGKCDPKYIEEIRKEVRLARDLNESPSKARELTDRLSYLYQDYGLFEESLQELQHKSLDADRNTFNHIARVAEIHKRMGNDESACLAVKESQLSQPEKDRLLASVFTK